MCKYNNTNCRFGEKCCYKHITSNTQNDTHELEAQVHHLEEIIRTMSSQIISFEKEMCSINKSMLVKSVFKCEECNYNASTETVLKRHVTSKHKHLYKTPEKSRESILNDSLKFAKDCEEKRDIPDISVHEEVTVEETSLKCAYWNCKFNCQDRSDLENHIHVKHVVDKSFKYTESTEELECL